MDFKFKINCPRVLENMSPTSESRKHLSQFNRCKYTKISINTHRKNNFQNNRLRISTLSKNNVELSSQEAYRRRQGLCFFYILFNIFVRNIYVFLAVKVFISTGIACLPGYSLLPHTKG